MKYSRSSVMKPIAGSISLHGILLHGIFTTFYFDFYDQT